MDTLAYVLIVVIVVCVTALVLPPGTLVEFGGTVFRFRIKRDRKKNLPP